MIMRLWSIAILALAGILSFAAPSHAKSKAEKIIVSGASGKLGELTVKELLRRGVDPHNLILTTRQPAELDEYAKMGATVRYADLTKPETLIPAFAGGTRMLLISITGKGPSAEAHKAGFDAAVKDGVKHIIYTSFIGAEKGAIPITADHKQTEAYLMASGVKWTVLRDGYYADIHVQAAIDMAKTGRALVQPNDWKVAAVTRADCAAAAAGALLDPALSENRVFEITGPELYNRTDVVNAVSAMTGKHIELVTLMPGMDRGPISLGAPASTPQVVTDAVAKLARRKPTGLRGLLEANRAEILAAAKG